MSHLKTGMYNLIKVLTYYFSMGKLYIPIPIWPWTASRQKRNSSYQNIATSIFTLCCGVAVTNKVSAPRTPFHITYPDWIQAIFLNLLYFKWFKRVLTTKPLDYSEFQFLYIVCSLFSVPSRRSSAVELYSSSHGPQNPTFTGKICQ